MSTQPQESINTSAETTNVVTNSAIEKEAFNLSPVSVMLLTCISNLQKQDNPVSATNIIAAVYPNETEETMPEDVVKLHDDSLSVLLYHRLVTIGMDGKIRTTKAGENAVGNGIAISYPVGKTGTIVSYDKTLRTQTASAGDALLIAQSNNHDWITGRSAVALGAMLNAFAKTSAFVKAPIGALLNLYEKATSYLTNDSSVLPYQSKARISYAMAKSWKDSMVSNIANICNNAGDITLKNPVRIDAEVEITKVSASTEAMCTTRNVFTQEESEVALSDFNIDVINQVHESI